MDKRNIFDRFFPVKYDFYGMLNKQAELNMLGVNMLYKWLSSRSKNEKEELLRYVKEADEVRHDMESKLIEAFITPFDREEIYSISVEMDKIIEFAKSTLESMEAYEVEPNNVIINMVEKLKEGTDFLFESLTILESNPIKSQQNIIKMAASFGGPGRRSELIGDGAARSRTRALLKESAFGKKASHGRRTKRRRLSGNAGSQGQLPERTADRASARDRRLASATKARKRRDTREQDAVNRPGGGQANAGRVSVSDQ